jgi:acyl transferase domain-containing protein/3-hydroxymyristoyl/3-hydroxydecanoyl-(acyl carrier protein) dehydratase
MDMSPPIAIVGLGGLFSGSPTPQRLWDNIVQARDTSRDVPSGRWLLAPEDAYDPTIAVPDRAYTIRGYYLDDIPVDLTGLSLDPDLIRELDPLFHLVLHVGDKAWRDARTENLDRSRVGVIFGNIVLPTEKSSALTQEILGAVVEPRTPRGGNPWDGTDLAEAPSDGFGYPQTRRCMGNCTRLPRTTVHRFNRYVAGLPAGLLARALGLGGSACALDAACASSLFALKLAVDRLQNGQADAMLAGGVCRPDSLYLQMGFSQLRALSPSGRCRPLDAAGDGLMVGEGAGFFILKRLQDALAQGDRIYAVIAGVGLSNDTRGNLLAPDAEGQLRALRAAYRQAGWRPDDVDLIECHATGTPVGDAVELESLHRLWQECNAPTGRCVIGSVKANVGHTLTAAGSAGLLKVLLALRARTLPPTANLNDPRAGALAEKGPFRVLREPVSWEPRDRSTPRRAAISAFGFGGTNAHVLIEEWRGEPQAPARSQKPAGSIQQVRVPGAAPLSRSPSVGFGMSAPTTPIAIVGLGADFGPWDGLLGLQQRVFGNSVADQAPTTPAGRWWGVEGSRWFREQGLSEDAFRGWFVDKLSISLGEFRIPPRDLEEMLPQQLLMLQVAAQALADARLEEYDRLRIGVFIGLALDLNTTNFHFRWSLLNRARQWNQELQLGLSPMELKDWTVQLREATGPALTAGRVLGALGSVTASRIARAFGIGGPSFTMASEETSALAALETAVALLRRKELDHAIVGAVDLPGDVRTALAGADGCDDSIPLGEGAAAVVLRRLDDAERDKNKIYAVLRGLGAGSGGSSAHTAVQNAYRDAGLPARPVDAHAGDEANAFHIANEDRPGVQLGSPRDRLGSTGAASGLASLVQAVLALHHRILPPLRSVRAAQYWLHDRAAGPRRVVLTHSGIDDNTRAVILEEPPRSAAATKDESGQPIGRREEGLFAVEAADASGLIQKLTKLRSHAENSARLPVDVVAQRWLDQQPMQPQQPLACALVARDLSDLLRQIDAQLYLLRQGRSAEHAAMVPRENDPSLADRMFCTPAPLMRGQLAFVFPGSGSHFAGMGRDFSVQWPQVFRRQEEENKLLRSQFAPEVFWDLSSLDDVRDHRRLIQGQVALGTALSDLIQLFGVRPDAALGYSLGETTALFALRVWADRDEMLRRLFHSPLFAEQLAGNCTAARQAWRLPPGEAVDWVAGVVARPSEQVRRVVQGEDRVYLLLINTPEECVLGGQRGAVERVVAELGCAMVPLSGVSTVHCEIAREVEAAYRELHQLPVSHVPGIRFYSCASACGFMPDRESCAETITAQALRTVDFAGLIQQAYQDGVRIFVEVGPGASGSRMISQILAGKPHLARSACIQGQGAVSTVLRLLAQLIAWRVPLNLEALYGPGDVMDDPGPKSSNSANRLTVTPGHPPLQLPPPAAAKELPLHSDKQPCLSAARAEPEQRRTATCGCEPEHSAAQQIDELRPHSWADDQRIQSLDGLVAMREAGAAAHSSYLQFSSRAHQIIAEAAKQNQVKPTDGIARDRDATVTSHGGPPKGSIDAEARDAVAAVRPPPSPVAFDRGQCLEFAGGTIGNVLGADFATVDAFPTRVRLPAEPLMLVDRILTIEGQPKSLGSGRIVTEHDFFAGDWYLDAGRAPASITIESGQADLFLSAFLGADFQTRGRAVYRLLDATVTFHRSLPSPGEVARYDIHIDRFFRQGDTLLFRFGFEGTVDGQSLLTMTDGCAGFFSAEELASGKGIVRRANAPGLPPAGPWRQLIPVDAATFDEAQLDALRAGDLGKCFGSQFTHLDMHRSLTLPDGQLRVIHRITKLDPCGGPAGLGAVKAEQDIHPGDWFLTCHFIDDQVMPGTLMYECCLHTLRFYLLRLGWVAEAGQACFEPRPGVAARLKCRGQVIAATRTASYEITIKKLGKEPHPYALADALMYADGKPIVEITDLSLQLSGVTYEYLEAQWTSHSHSVKSTGGGAWDGTDPLAAPSHALPPVGPTGPDLRHQTPLVFDRRQILAFALGRPSEAYGARYQPFDQGRRLARLPAPPYSFIDRVLTTTAQPWKMSAGGTAEVQYDVPPEAWYFQANRQSAMPFAVLQEIALQSCGWMAAYVGSALTTPVDLRFRNLGGTAVQLAQVTAGSGTLTTSVHFTKVASSGGMTLQEYDFSVRDIYQVIYQGTTNFGFFTDQALAQQVGIRDAAPPEPSAQERSRAKSFPYPADSPFPERQWRMIDRVESYVSDGGPHDQGLIRCSYVVDPDAWFFRAHFFQDPVCPGSLGLEALLQLLKSFAVQRFGACRDFETPMVGKEHRWRYRGQILPSNARVDVMAAITAVDEGARSLTADGWLSVDGLVIYHMSDFSLRIVE